MGVVEKMSLVGGQNQKISRTSRTGAEQGGWAGAGAGFSRPTFHLMANRMQRGLLATTILPSA